MRILFVAAEAAPIAKVGGMGDVVGALPKVLRQMGHDVRIFMPYYGFLPDKMQVPSEPVWHGDAMFNSFDVYETVLPGTDVPLYLFGHPTFAGRSIYGGADEDWRFTFFANGAAEFCLELLETTNYSLPRLAHGYDSGVDAPRPRYQYGLHDSTTSPIKGPWRWRLDQMTWCPWYMQGHNTMAAAVQFADRVNTVSPTYAQQIRTAEYGETLEGLLSFISGKTVGIVNGIDVESYNPETDKYIPHKFTVDTFEQRHANKIALQEEIGLQVNAGTFLMGMVTRLVDQKGIDLLIQVLDRFMAYTDTQFVLLGTGDRYYETQMWEMASRYRGRMSAQLLYNDALARRIYAGSDAFLMPSRFEPCGISQMLAMRYGCVPIVRRTGGLVDTVSHHDPVNQTGTGYCFDRYEPLDFYTCMVRASEAFRFKDQWHTLQQRGMRKTLAGISQL
jgi:starch synthase